MKRIKVFVKIKLNALECLSEGDFTKKSRYQLDVGGTNIKDQNKSYKSLGSWTQILHTCNLLFYSEEIKAGNYQGCTECCLCKKRERLEQSSSRSLSPVLWPWPYI